MKRLAIGLLLAALCAPAWANEPSEGDAKPKESEEVAAVLANMKDLMAQVSALRARNAELQRLQTDLQEQTRLKPDDKALQDKLATLQDEIVTHRVAVSEFETAMADAQLRLVAARQKNRGKLKKKPTPFDILRFPAPKRAKSVQTLPTWHLARRAAALKMEAVEHFGHRHDPRALIVRANKLHGRYGRADKSRRKSLAGELKGLESDIAHVEAAQRKAAFDASVALLAAKNASGNARRRAEEATLARRLYGVASKGALKRAADFSELTAYAGRRNATTPEKIALMRRALDLLEKAGAQTEAQQLRVRIAAMKAAHGRTGSDSTRAAIESLRAEVRALRADVAELKALLTRKSTPR